LALWIKNARAMKPGVIMPTLGLNQYDPVLKHAMTSGGLTDQQIADIVAYLQGLKKTPGRLRDRKSMATTAGAPAYAHAETSQTGLWSWLTTVDHKRIGTLYLYTALSWFAVGGLEALIMRIQLQGPNGHVVSAETFNQLFTMHGTTMIFLVVMP